MLHLCFCLSIHTPTKLYIFPNTVLGKQWKQQWLFFFFRTFEKKTANRGNSLREESDDKSAICIYKFIE